jgi:hypothetical protein
MFDHLNNISQSQYLCLHRLNISLHNINDILKVNQNFTTPGKIKLTYKKIYMKSKKKKIQSNRTLIGALHSHKNAEPHITIFTL